TVAATLATETPTATSTSTAVPSSPTATSTYTPTPTLTGTPGPNLLQNGSFETLSNGFPASWQARATAFADTTVSHSGSTSLRVEGPASGSATTYSFQRFNLTP